MRSGLQLPVRRSTTERSFEDRSVICRAGEPAAAVYRVRAGALMVRPAGGGAPALLLAGDIFGAEALLAGGTYGAEAVAHGRTVVDVVGRDEVIAALGRRPEAVLPLIRAALEARDAGDAPGDLDGASRHYRLIPMSDMLAEQIGADGVLVASLPFVVGRLESQNGSARGVNLVLRDRQPYNLSRRHFAIERHDGIYIVRDHDSHHGTHVNGVHIGSEAADMTAPLRPGENLIVAGTVHSPIRFSFVVG